MIQFKSIILITVIGLAVLFPGCVGKPPVGTPTPTPIVTASPTVTATPIATTPPTVTATPIVTATPTPTVTTPIGQLSGAIFVDARMKQPSNLGDGTYELSAVQVQVSSQINSPISIKAQLMSDGQILEEKSFSLQSVGSGYSFGIERPYVINSTNVTLRMVAEGYQPSEYQLKIYR